jgi:hypothetical protein
MSENVGASTSRNPKGLYGIYRENFTLHFFTFTLPSIDHPEYGLVQPDHFHLPFIIDSAMPVRRHKKF